MNRKNTILIAVLINAGLLSVLLIAALTTQDEPNITPALMGDATARLEERPLFGDSMDLAMRKNNGELTPIPIPLPEMGKSIENAQPLNAQLQIPAEPQMVSVPAKEEPIVHQLPALAPEPNSVSAAATVSPANQPVVSANRPVPSFVEVTVKKGDNLEKIAKQQRTTVDEIIKLNQLPSSFLRVGQVLKIPSSHNTAPNGLAAAPSPKKSVKSASESGSAEYYTVKVGDNPWTIAMKHHIKVEELLRLNGLNEEKARKLKPGDRLRTR